MVVKTPDSQFKKVFLSSIRPPRQTENTENQSPNKRSRPLYDVPYMFEAREFLRTKLIGKKVNTKYTHISILFHMILFLTDRNIYPAIITFTVQ